MSSEAVEALRPGGDLKIPIMSVSSSPQFQTVPLRLLALLAQAGMEKSFLIHCKGLG